MEQREESIREKKKNLDFENEIDWKSLKKKYFERKKLNKKMETIVKCDFISLVLFNNEHDTMHHRNLCSFLEKKHEMEAKKTQSLVGHDVTDPALNNQKFHYNTAECITISKITTF